MSVEAMAWAFKQDLPDSQIKLVLLSLCDHADEDGRCWPSQERLAQKSACSVRTVRRRIQQLADMGILTIRYRPQKTPIYVISFIKSNMIGQRGRHRHKMLIGQTQDVDRPLVADKPSIDSKPSVEDSNAPSARADDLFEQAEAEPMDEPPKARLFRKGKTILVSLGLSEERSGSVIGGWLKQKYDPTGILAAIEYAHRQCAVSPVAYVTQILKGQTDGKAKPDIADTIRELADQARALERATGIGRPS